MANGSDSPLSIALAHVDRSIDQVAEVIRKVAIVTDGQSLLAEIRVLPDDVIPHKIVAKGIGHRIFRPKYPGQLRFRALLLIFAPAMFHHP